MMRPGSFVIATGGERIMLADAAPVSLSSRNQDVVQITKTRKKFPETWIWLTNQTKLDIVHFIKFFLYLILKISL